MAGFFGIWSGNGGPIFIDQKIFKIILKNEAGDKRGKRKSIFFIRYPLCKSAKTLRPVLSVIPWAIQKSRKLNVLHYIFSLLKSCEIFFFIYLSFSIKFLYPLSLESKIEDDFKFELVSTLLKTHFFTY